MSTVSVTQFSAVGSVSNGSLMCPQAPFIATEDISASTTSAQSAAFDSQTRFVRIMSDANVRVRFGSNPTATATDMPIRANSPEFVAVVSGDKIAVIEG